MPRNPGAKKNQQNNRHENGVVAPGKRVPKQKSNGYINGVPKGAVPDTPPLTPLVSESLLSDTVDNGSNSSLAEPRGDYSAAPKVPSFQTQDSESSSDGVHEGVIMGNTIQIVNNEGANRRDGNTGIRKPENRPMSTIYTASTIVRSLPAYDTIAILILLLQLPPIILTLVQVLFSSLTFMPPTGMTLGSIIALFDIFQGTAGPPGMGTTVGIDALVIGIWFFVPSYIQSLVLDAAQIQVAVTLGGGGSDKNSGVYGTCWAIILGLHLVRSRSFRRLLFRQSWYAKLVANDHVARVFSWFPRDSEFDRFPSSKNWLQNALALHIVAQSLTAIGRRWAKRSKDASSSSAKQSKRQEHDTSLETQSIDSANFESANSGSAAGIELNSATSTSREGRDRHQNAKKRRRQANQVRSRQPFWAALASTKVTVMREYEHTKGSGQKANGKPPHDAANTSSQGDEIVFITQIDPSNIKFETMHILAETDQDGSLDPTCRPFYVKINGQAWKALSLAPLSEKLNHVSDSGQWSGEILGLAPNCTYTCSFIRIEDESEICSIMVKTPMICDKDQTAHLAAPVVAPPRSTSPISTIKTGISNAEHQLEQARLRLQKTRKAQKAAMTKAEKEVESLKQRLTSNGDEDKHRRKIMQFDRSIEQSKEQAHQIDSAMEAMATIPEEELEEWSSKKARYQEQSKLLSNARETLSSANSAKDVDLKEVKAELSQVSKQKQKLTIRQAKLNDDHERITQANAQGLNEKERQAADAQAKQNEIARVESQYAGQISGLRRELYDIEEVTRRTHAQLNALEQQTQLANSHYNPLLYNCGPLTPEGIIPGTGLLMHNATTTSRPGAAFSYFPGAPPFSPSATVATVSSNDASTAITRHSPFQQYAKTFGPPPTTKSFGRPRSQSNRSMGAISNYSEDFEDANPIPPMPVITDFDPGQFTVRKESGSSRGANNNSPGLIGAVGSPMRAHAKAPPAQGSPGPAHAIPGW